MVIRPKAPRPKAIYLVAALVIIALLVSFFKVAPSPEKLAAQSLWHYADSSENFLFSLNTATIKTLLNSSCYLPESSSSEIKIPSSDTPNSENSSVSPESSLVSEQNPDENKIFFQTKTVNLYPTVNDGMSFYGRVFVNAKKKDVKKLLGQEVNLKDKKILILCTHFTEGYSENTDKYSTDLLNTEDETKNVFSVASLIAKRLSDAGITVILSDKAYDLPLYNGAFERSGEDIASKIKDDADIALVLDIHRDTLKEENLTGLRTVTAYGGKPASQIMMAVTNDASLSVAVKIQNLLEAESPTITRPTEIFSSDYGYSGKTPRIILSVGTQSNTLSESILSTEILSQAIINVIKG